MSGVARHIDTFHSQTTFYKQAAAGTLPSFSWFSPSLQACDHPCHDIAKGERLLKDVYESLRAGPAWNRTMFVLVYDDIGAYFDPIIPPFEGVPAPDAPCNSYNDGFPSKFDFRRLGGRSTAMMMGGKVPKAVFQEPDGPTNTSQFDLTSIAATVHTLFNLSTPLTRRTMWSGTFDALLLNDSRPDSEMPLHLPDAPAPTGAWIPPPGGGDDDRRRLQEGKPLPQHCGASEQTCRGHEVLSVKQERLVARYAELTGNEVPANVGAMTPQQAEKWLAEHWELWRGMGHPTN